MEIDKKIIKKLIDTLEDLKKSLKGNEIVDSDEPTEEEVDVCLLNQELNLLFQLEKKLKKVKLC